MKAGQSCNALIQIEGIFPIILEITQSRTETIPDMDGKNFAPGLIKPGSFKRDDFYFEFGYTRGVRTDKFK